jgi:hypothetical protein
MRDFAVLVSKCEDLLGFGSGRRKKSVKDD